MCKALAVSLVLTVALLGAAAWTVASSQPKASAYRYNPYHPYSVETSIRDR